MSAAQIERAAALLDAGGLVAFPTETVYGLGGDAESPDAVARIYAAKGRPANHPVIVHLAPQGDPNYWVEHLPAERAAADRRVLARAAHADPQARRAHSAAVSGGQDSVGLRCPSHPVAQALLEAFSALRGGHGGVAAPSANRFGHVSPTTAQHVRDEFGSAIHVLDGGASDVGIESTIVDLSRGFPALLRPGRVTPQDIADVLGEAPRLPDGIGCDCAARFWHVEGALRAAHTVGAVALRRARTFACRACRRMSAWRWSRARRVPDIGPMPRACISSPRLKIRMSYARELYGLLRALDRANVTRILIEKLPDTIEWIAVNDRLGRAAAAFEAQG